MKITAVVIALVGLILVPPANAGQANRKLSDQASRQKRVKVYFYHDPGEYIDLSPVERKVNAASPARAAIQALLGGPTRAEKRRGFDSLASANEFAIGSLKIADGTARVVVLQ